MGAPTVVVRLRGDFEELGHARQIRHALTSAVIACCFQ